MLYAYLTMKTCFHIQDSDVFWCTADCGWITGHTANVYGALLNGLTTLIFEGCPTYPDDSRIWRIIEEYKVVLSPLKLIFKNLGHKILHCSHTDSIINGMFE